MNLIFSVVSGRLSTLAYPERKTGKAVLEHEIKADKANIRL